MLSEINKKFLFHMLDIETYRCTAELVRLTETLNRDEKAYKMLHEYFEKRLKLLVETKNELQQAIVVDQTVTNTPAVSTAGNL